MKKETPLVTGSLIAASAGTGKTYQLAGRYIALLALGAEPESLIAMTFTNKAAGEFRSRIFKTLAEGAKDKKNAQGRNELSARIMEVLSARTLRIEDDEWSLGDSKLTVPLVPDTVAWMEKAVRCKVYPETLMAEFPPIGKALDADFFRGLLKKMVLKTSQLKLYTFDSFFQSTVNRNKMLLGLSSISPLTGADEETAREEAINALIKEADATPESAAVFHEITDGAEMKGRLLRDELKESVKTYRTLYTLFREDQWGNLTKFGLPQTIAEQQPWTEEQRKDALAELKRFAERHPDMSGRDIKKIQAAESQTEEIIRDFKFDSLEKHADPANARKGSAINKLIELPTDSAAAGEYVKKLNDYIEHAIEEMKRSVYGKTVSMCRLMKAYDEAYQKSILSTGRMSFNEIKDNAARLLSGELDNGTLAFNETGVLWHWMLDEFQDTDPGQWEALSPLLEEVAQEDHIDKTVGATTFPSAEKSLFVVGDEKQSIYAWRGATPALFSMLKGTGRTEWEQEEGIRFSQALNQATLDETFRSSAVITDFVNALFKGMGCGDEFTHHRSAARSEYLKQPLRGYVEIGKLSGSSAAEVRQNALCRIQKILAGLKDPAATGRLKHGISAAVLVRNNKDAKEITEALQKSGLGVEVQLVADHPLVQASPVSELMLNFFRWLQHPSDAYLSGLIIMARLGEHIRKSAEETTQQPARSAVHWLKKLEQEGYLAVVDELITLLPYRDATVQTWQQMAMRFDESGGSLSDWIGTVSQASEKNIPAKGVVQVMTMHKSKGLEFDVVIAPFLSDESVTNPRKLTYLVSQEKDALMLAPNASARRIVPDFAAAEKRWAQQQLGEARNLMYVALTRAKHAQYILLGNKGKQDSEINMIEKALEKMPTTAELPEPQCETAEAEPVYRTLYIQPGSEADWVQQQAEEEAASQQANEGASAPAPAAEEEFEPLGEAEPALQKVHPSETEFEAIISDEPKPEGYELRGDAAEFGTAVHALFEQVEWLDKGEQPGWLNAPQNEAERLAARALAVPEIRRFFLSAEYPGAEVQNEQLLEKIERNTWTTAIIDRLMLLPDGTALILDFKTDWARKGLEDRHRHQMEQYRSLVHEATDIDLQNISVCLLAVGCAQPCAVPVIFAE